MLDILRSYKAGIFKALGHPDRVAIVEFLRYGEREEERLREKVRIESEPFAQHIAILSRKAIVRVRTDGGRRYYSLLDPAFGQVLDALREYFLDHLTESIAMLREERENEASPTGEGDLHRKGPAQEGDPNRSRVPPAT